MPLPIHAAIPRKGNRTKLFGARDPDIGQPPFFLEPLEAALIHAALGREQSILPSRQEHRRKLEPLGRMKRHDRDLFLGLVAFIVHDETDMFEKPLQVLEALQRLDQFLEVLEPSRRLGRFVVLPHGRVARLIKDDLGKLHMRQVRVARHPAPARQALNKDAKLFRPLAADSFLFEQDPRSFDERNPVGPRAGLDLLLCDIAKAALGRVHDPLKRKVVVGADHEAEIRHRVADFQTLIEPRPADHAVGQTDGQEPIFKRPHLVRRAHEDCHVIQ